MFSSIGMPELMIILIIALIVFGPGKLPKVGAALGAAIGEFKKAANSMADESSGDDEKSPDAASWEKGEQITEKSDDRDDYRG
ncbi:MAG: twin-arginine translocase TatA/TatE family subunit [Candidatus Wallbacteria bacterium HGW-Wallbacteria-1]|uniref:Sec-independent protein translocase protein TatA n=1 Tax=Candidatus Wallbacteria bacterium HGW-Wallbacteria-1 TaxID=2013854 RepID=A0A2N1PV72_9BACT|nr:MAG: twin-arginine translocase TatA/TatE family subunit [Candidatus Wallbacteria bacterium HGW-Wallbacteria-1]